MQFVARHGDIIITRIKGHRTKKTPVTTHMTSCQNSISMEGVTILAASSRSTNHLMTLEALFIDQLRPQLNTKDEYKSGTLVVKF